MFVVDQRGRTLHQANAVLHAVQRHREVPLLARLSGTPQINQEALHQRRVGKPLKELVPLVLQMRAVFLYDPLFKPLRELGPAFGVCENRSRENDAIHPVRKRSRELDGDDGAGVMTDEDRFLNFECIENAEDSARVLSHRGLTLDRVGAAVAGIIDSDGPAMLREEGKDFGELVHRARGLVKQNQRRPSTRSRLDSVNLAHRRVAEKTAWRGHRCDYGRLASCSPSRDIRYSAVRHGSLVSSIDIPAVMIAKRSR